MVAIKVETIDPQPMCPMHLWFYYLNRRKADVALPVTKTFHFRVKALITIIFHVWWSFMCNSTIFEELNCKRVQIKVSLSNKLHKSVAVL